MAKNKELTKPILVRRSPAERAVIKNLAADVGLSEARLMVTAALMLGDFPTPDELRAALHVGGQLWQTRTHAVIQVRRLGHQLERLRNEIGEDVGSASQNKLEEALAEIISVLRKLKAS
jgi:hypothetical protein